MIICIEGNIGSGKSSVLASVALAEAFPDAAIFPEPLDEWGELLDLFYNDPVTWALPFQLRVLLSFRRPAKAKATEDLVLVERSPLSCRHVFGQLLFNDGKMLPREWELFKEFCDDDVLGWKPDAIIYVDAPVDVLLQRVASRGRACEQNVDEAYLRKSQFQYETLCKYLTIPVVRIDGSQSPDRVAEAAVAALVKLVTDATTCQN